LNIIILYMISGLSKNTESLLACLKIHVRMAASGGTVVQ